MVSALLSNDKMASTPRRGMRRGSSARRRGLVSDPWFGVDLQRRKRHSQGMFWLVSPASTSVIWLKLAVGLVLGSQSANGLG